VWSYHGLNLKSRPRRPHCPCSTTLCLGPGRSPSRNSAVASTSAPRSTSLRCKCAPFVHELLASWLKLSPPSHGQQEMCLVRVVKMLLVLRKLEFITAASASGAPSRIWLSWFSSACPVQVPSASYPRATIRTCVRFLRDAALL
jgi:hypothetical protein